ASGIEQGRKEAFMQDSRVPKIVSGSACRCCQKRVSTVKNRCAAPLL
ncbi:hypothetical protein A2U01_0047726, partial [Trifolium medium]|nr:hypothetical protein [Trifolium medium]